MLELIAVIALPICWARYPPASLWQRNCEASTSASTALAMPAGRTSFGCSAGNPVCSSCWPIPSRVLSPPAGSRASLLDGRDGRYDRAVDRRYRRCVWSHLDGFRRFSRRQRRRHFGRYAFGPLSTSLADLSGCLCHCICPHPNRLYRFDDRGRGFSDRAHIAALLFWKNDSGSSLCLRLFCRCAHHLYPSLKYQTPVVRNREPIQTLCRQRIVRV